MFRRGLLTLLVVAPVAVQAQAGAANGNWVARHQDAMWVGVTVEEHLSERTQFWFDGSWRRMNFGADPQQLLLRPGVLFTVAPGLRVGGGYAYIATAPYGLLPIANPTREHRSWQDIRLSHKAGPVTFAHRYRLEQRWISPLLRTGTDDVRTRGPAMYQNRMRYQGRGTVNVPRLTLRGRPITAFVWDELLMPIGGNQAALSIGQNRATVGFGLPVDARQRIEVGYMNLSNMFAARRANEINHTLWLSYHWTGQAPAPRRPAK
ncbi:MAG: DUF2490 domain-containing protein [Gemmatimonadaceae bacterium]|nr:DUF2490 domain-containing protein [Gemmatimonadaceae bacterium]